MKLIAKQDKDIEFRGKVYKIELGKIYTALPIFGLPQFKGNYRISIDNVAINVSCKYMEVVKENAAPVNTSRVIPKTNGFNQDPDYDTEIKELRESLDSVKKQVHELSNRITKVLSDVS